MPRVAITGATGFIGSRLVHDFMAAGWEVVALVRDPGRTGATLGQARDPERLSVREFHMPDAISESTLEGCDAVVHCAYLPYTRQCPDSDRINWDSMTRLLALSRKSGLRKFVFLSSFAAHEQALSHYGRLKLRMEGLLDLRRDLIVRPGLVIGDGGLFGRIARSVQKNPWVLLVDRGDQPVQTIWIEDLSRILVRLVSENRSGRIELAEPNPGTLRELCEQVAMATGRKPRFISLPYGLAYFGARVGELLGLPLPVTRENLLGLKAMRAYEIEAEPGGVPLDLTPTEIALQRIQVKLRENLP